MTHWGDAAIHAHVGLLIFSLAIVILRRPVRSGIPLLLVALAEAGNETIDFIMQTNWSLADTLSDIFHTLLWPLVFTVYATVIARRRPRSVR